MSLEPVGSEVWPLREAASSWGDGAEAWERLDLRGCAQALLDGWLWWWATQAPWGEALPARRHDALVHLIEHARPPLDAEVERGLWRLLAWAEASPWATSDEDHMRRAGSWVEEQLTALQARIRAALLAQETLWEADAPNEAPTRALDDVAAGDTPSSSAQSGGPMTQRHSKRRRDEDDEDEPRHAFGDDDASLDEDDASLDEDDASDDLEDDEPPRASRPKGKKLIPAQEMWGGRGREPLSWEGVAQHLGLSEGSPTGRAKAPGFVGLPTVAPPVGPRDRLGRITQWLSREIEEGRVQPEPVRKDEGSRRPTRERPRRPRVEEPERPLERAAPPPSPVRVAEAASPESEALWMQAEALWGRQAREPLSAEVQEELINHCLEALEASREPLPLSRLVVGLERLGPRFRGWTPQRLRELLSSSPDVVLFRNEQLAAHVESFEDGGLTLHERLAEVLARAAGPLSLDLLQRRLPAGVRYHPRAVRGLLFGAPWCVKFPDGRVCHVDALGLDERQRGAWVQRALGLMPTQEPIACEALLARMRAQEPDDTTLAREDARGVLWGLLMEDARAQCGPRERVALSRGEAGVLLVAEAIAEVMAEHELLGAPQLRRAVVERYGARGLHAFRDAVARALEQGHLVKVGEARYGRGG